MAGIEFKAPPTCATFQKSEAFGRVIAGPVGSGKTTSCIMELFRRALEQKPGIDGIRHTRFAIVRQTLKQLKDTVLKDVQGRLGQVGHWMVSNNTFYVEFGDVQSEWMFVPLENSEDQARLLSMQLTGAFLSECIEMDFDIIGPVSGRIGRYPAGDQGNCTWYGIIADTNMPTEMTPWHQFMTNPPLDWQVFFQPSGLAPDAENLNYLLQTDETRALKFNDPVRVAQGRKYYERFVSMYGENSDWVKRYVYAQFGDDPSGMAVFRETFRSDFHVTPDTLPIPGYPLIIGQDFGRNPWSLICQSDHMGRLLVHEEVPATNMGLEKHVQENLRPRLLSDKYLGYRVAIVGDPSGVNKGTTTEESCFELLKRLGIPAFPAITNDTEPRLRAVEALLGRQTQGKASLLISAAGCPKLIRGLGGGYRFTKTKDGKTKTAPDKNDKEGFSHVQDCLQYVCLVVNGGLVPVISRMLYPRPKKVRQPFTSEAWT
jgi:hypothetical protein